MRARDYAGACAQTVLKFGAAQAHAQAPVILGVYLHGNTRAPAVFGGLDVGARNFSSTCTFGLGSFRYFIKIRSRGPLAENFGHPRGFISADPRAHTNLWAKHDADTTLNNCTRLLYASRAKPQILPINRFLLAKLLLYILHLWTKKLHLESRYF